MIAYMLIVSLSTAYPPITRLILDFAKYARKPQKTQAVLKQRFIRKLP